MKKLSYFLTVLCFVACNGNQPSKPTNDETNPNDFVDLGLPSGTKWQKVNEKADSVIYFLYDDAIKQFPSSLPTAQQWKELMVECVWTWTKDCQEVVVGDDTIMLSGYKIFGHNGDSIMLPSAGCCNCSGEVCHFNKYGFYMSSTTDGSDGVKGMTFYHDEIIKDKDTITIDTMYIGYYLYCDGLPIRRIMK